MSTSHLSADAVRRALSIRDLTDPAQGPHALQQLVSACAERLAEAWACTASIERASPIVSISDNYDRLRYPDDGPARDARHSRYVCDVALLRTQTSAMIPPLLRRLTGEDALLVCPGIVYRRDSIDRLHTGEPHQLDVWRIAAHPLGPDDLRAMVGHVLDALLPDRAWRVTPADHPYTTEGLQIDVEEGETWIEVGECGLAHPALLSHLPGRSGLALGLGLDRVLMLRKGLDDIRLLRATEPRIATQMLDLEPYRAVSSMPPVARDLSIVVATPTTAEELGDRVRSALGARADAIESVTVLTETSHSALPAAARARLRLSPAQKNVLLRIVIRDLERTLTHAEANDLRDTIYAAVHEGEIE